MQAVPFCHGILAVEAKGAAADYSYGAASTGIITGYRINK